MTAMFPPIPSDTVIAGAAFIENCIQLKGFLFAASSKKMVGS